MVESQPSKLLVAGSIPVSRSSLRSRMARVGEATAGKPWQITVAPESFEVDAVCSRRADLSAEAFSAKRNAKADVAQLAERVLGKDEVTSSILVIGSRMVDSERVVSIRRGLGSERQG